jgi:uncharacterized membrane protein
MSEKHKNHLTAAVTAVTAVRSSFCRSNSIDSSKMSEKHKNHLTAAVTAVTAVRSSYCRSNSSDSSKIILLPQ